MLGRNSGATTSDREATEATPIMTIHEALIAYPPTVTFDLRRDIHKGIQAELFTVTATAEVMSTPDLDLLALDFEAHGLAGRDLAVGAVVRAARAAGLSPVLVDLLCDTAEPEVARLRAFGRLAALLSRPHRTDVPAACDIAAV